MVRVKIFYFAQAREAAGTKEEEFRLEGQPSVRRALLRAFEAHPKLSGLEKALKIAVNEEIVEENIMLHDGDRVALLPPVVGG